MVMVAASGCDSGVAPGADAESPRDASPMDATAADAGRDSGSPNDAGARDAFVADAFVADAFVADAFVADAFVADAFVADAFVADAGVDGGARCVIDGVREAWEDCDDGNDVAGDGCDPDCTISCVDPTLDCASPPPCSQHVCSSSGVCTPTPDPLLDGTACGTGGLCGAGVCAVCGDGAVQGLEACDFGTENGPQTGCEADCTFSCDTDADCDDLAECNGAESCVEVTVDGHTGRACAPGTAPAECSACTGGLCAGGACAPSSCGDGCVDATAGEECEPPATGSCDASCQLVVCGNGLREMGETCDDGNTTNLDGCSASCRFEQVHRVTYLQLDGFTSAFCTANRFGGAFGALARFGIQSTLNTYVASGALSWLFVFRDLDDLSGASDAALSVGVVSAAPAVGPSYDGTDDLDWWHVVAAADLATDRTPLRALPGAMASSILDAGPGRVVLRGSSTLGTLALSSTRLRVSVGAASTPLASAGGPPGHLSSENLDPALTSFEHLGQHTSAGSGRLCGNISARSLAQTPIPSVFVGTGGTPPCSQAYTSANTLLDLVVGGCDHVFNSVSPTQPDQADLTSPQPGAGGPYALVPSAATRAVTTCRDRTGAVVDLAACLDAAAYSAHFSFATGRVIAR